MHYHDMIIEASNASLERMPDKQRIGKFGVRVLGSPAGEMTPEEAAPISYDDKQLQLALAQLEHRLLSQAGLIVLGRQLADWLLPPKAEGAATGVRELFAASLAQIGPDDGLRLRLRLPPQLAALPWEYVYIDQAGGGDGMDGFLTLDPRVAIVRHEALAAPESLPPTSGALKVVVALASAEGLPPLNLAKEQADLQQAFAGQAGITPVFLSDATLDEVQSAIVGAAIFHFAGHAMFSREMSDLPGTYSGVGSLALYDQAVNAEQLGINLRGNGVRLAVLGGCETGRRDGVNAWSGIAPVLIKQQIPAVIANQFPIDDECAIAFSKQLYAALVGGLPIERAVAAGRIAAYNANPTGCDWGVAVLYLRDADGVLFGGAAEEHVRQQAADQAHAVMNVRVEQLTAGGHITGVKGTVGKGSLESTITVGTATDSEIDGAKLNVTGGDVKTDINVGKTEGKTTIEAGEITL